MPGFSETLLRTYGPLMSSKETTVVLKYPTTNALRMAVLRGQLELRPVRLPGRRGTFYATEAVAATLEAWVNGGAARVGDRS